MFGIQNYAEFIIAVVIFLMIPGAGNMSLVTSTSQGGWRGGLAASCGIMIGDQVLLWAAVLGVAALLATYPTVFLGVQWIGAAYLIWLGLNLCKTKIKNQSDSLNQNSNPNSNKNQNPNQNQNQNKKLDLNHSNSANSNLNSFKRFLYQALSITLLNPKAIVFYMAFFPQFVDPQQHQGFLTFAVMAATIVVLGFLYSLVIIFITHFLASRLRTHPKITHAFEKLAGCLFIGFGFKLAFFR